MSRGRPASILQHTAIVAAGMASIGLTVAAGTYVVNQIAETGRMPGTQIALPGTGLTDETPAHESNGRESTTAPRLSGEIGLVAESEWLPAAPVDRPTATAPSGHPVPATASTATTPQTVPPAMRVHLPGDTYVGANVTRPQPDSLTMTIDTNVLSAVTAMLAARLGEQPGVIDPAGVTRISTAVDTRRGEVTVAVSDPILGGQSVRLSRRDM